VARVSPSMRNPLGDTTLTACRALLEPGRSPSRHRCSSEAPCPPRHPASQRACALTRAPRHAHPPLDAPKPMPWLALGARAVCIADVVSRFDPAHPAVIVLRPL
jgi:hypothetical protein